MTNGLVQACLRRLLTITRIGPKRTFLEFFAGIGLMRLALERSGWKCVFANDNDPKKVKIYTDNFGPGIIDSRGIEDLTGRNIPAATLATASFPCQDLSEAGSRRGIRGPRSRVFWHFVRIIKEMKAARPPLILIENVRGALNGKNGGNLTSAVKALNELGYICDVALVDAKYFVPQSRPRVFVAGLLRRLARVNRQTDIRSFDRDHPFRPAKILRCINLSPKLNWSLSDLPPVSRAKLTLRDILDPNETVPSDYWFAKDEVDRHLKMMSEKHRTRFEMLYEKQRTVPMTMYRRMRVSGQKAELRFDGIAGCLRTPTGGSSKQFVVTAEGGRVRIRRLTISEMSRLMGVPPRFTLPDNYLIAHKALGDAVVVPAVEWVAENMIGPLFELI